MDGAKACRLYSAVGANARLQRVGGRGVGKAARGVSRSEAFSSADLGGSSKYSSEKLED